MPVYDVQYIGPTKSPYAGEITRYKPFLLPSGAFEQLRNMYVFREIIRKRAGALVMDTSQPVADQQEFTRFRINLGPTVAGALAGIVPGTVFKIGQMFSIGTAKYTVVTAGAVQPMLQTVATTTATYSTTNGAFNFVGAPAGDVYFYPAEPVMHFGIYETSTINLETTIGFDTQFAYTYTNGSGWNRLTGGGGNNTWTTDANKNFYYWSWSFRGAADYDYTFYVTNNVAADAMRYYDGTNWNAWGSAATTPLGSPSPNIPFIKTARVIIDAPDTLLLMNTLENDGAMVPTDRRFVNRIRYSAPTTRLAPTNAGAWLVTNKAGFIDLPTKEAITAAIRLKDVTIIACERTYFRLSQTGNELEPYVVEEINSEQGGESVNSLIGFDEQILGFGSTGIDACNGQNVKRIDELIPTEIFEVNNANSGVERVQGLRDFFNEMAYWTYNSRLVQTTYNVIWPNRMLIYDYLVGSWAIWDDSISALGHFWKQTTSDQRQIGFQSVLAGNQEGWTFRIRDDVTRNSMSLQITNITAVGTTVTITAIDHNLADQSYVYLANIISLNSIFSAALNGNIYQVTTTSVDAFTITLAIAPGADTYRGGGTIERVSEPNILTKEYNFYGDQGVTTAFMKVLMYVDRTSNGQFTVDFIPSSSSISLISDATTTGAIIGTNILETTPYALNPLQAFQDRFWHEVNMPCTGEVIQLRMYLTDTQLRAVNISLQYVAFQDIQINGILFYTTPTQQY